MATIYVYGEIGYEVTDQGFAAELDEVPADERVVVAVNSPGGDVFQGQAIGALIKARGNVDVRIDGIAASAASYLALNGDTVTISSGGMMMLHKPMAMAYGNSLEFQELITILDKVEDSILVPAYAKKTGKPVAEIKAILEAETWLSAEECIEMGFCDALSDTPAVLDRLPKKFGDAYKNVPKALVPQEEAPKPETPVEPKADLEAQGDTVPATEDIKEPGLAVARARLRLLEVA